VLVSPSLWQLALTSVSVAESASESDCHSQNVAVLESIQPLELSQAQSVAMGDCPTTLAVRSNTSCSELCDRESPDPKSPYY